MTSQFVVLPSSTVCEYRRNKQNDYIATLARPIHGHNLSVRLASITFKKSWTDIHENNNTFYLCVLPEPDITRQYVEPIKKSLEIEGDSLVGFMSDGLPIREPVHKFTLDEGYYTNEEQIVDIMNRLSQYIINIQVGYAPKRIYMSVVPGVIVVLPRNGLGSVLGFREETDFLTAGDYQSKYPCFSLSRIQYFHIVLEGLTRPIICGNGRRAILETIPGDGEPEQVLEYHFKNNPFHKVLRQHLDTIRVQIFDNNFNPLPIITGETILTLEFQDEVQ